MTSPEHTLVGIHFAFAIGLHRRLGWKGVAMAGLASNVPDWDGLPMLIDMQRFEGAHRVWGHSVVSILAASALLGCTQAAFDWIGALGRWASACLPKAIPTAPETRLVWTGSVRAAAFSGIALIVQLLHLPCDMVVSGGEGVTDCAIQPWWPFSSAAYVYPLIPWGDVGPTLILMTGMIIAAKRPARISTISTLTLIALGVYLVARGWSRGLVSL